MASASPAAPLPAHGRAPLSGLGTAGWFVVAVLAAAGAGMLAVADDRLALDIALVAVAAVALYAYPFPALIALFLVAPKKSPFIDLLFLTAAAIVVLWRLPFLPSRAALLPLGLLLVFALPGVAWDSGYFAGGDGPELIMPVTGFAYLDTPSAEGFEWMRLGLVLMVGLTAAWQCTSVRRFQLLVGTAIVAGVLPLLTGLKQLAAGELVSKGDFSAVRGTFNYPNEFGLFLVLFMLLGVVAVFELRARWARIATAVLSGTGLLMLFHTYTRSAWIAFAVGLMFIAVVRYRSLIAVALVVLVIAVVGFPSAVQDVQARFGDLASQNAANSKNSVKWRRGQWEAMWHFGSEKPLTGQGFGSYRRKTVEQFGLQGRTYGTVQDAEQTGRLSLGFTAHNDFVKHWVETGGTGLLLWIATLVGLVVVQLRAMRVRVLAAWATGLLGVTAAFVMMSFSDNVQGYTVPMLYLFGLTAGIGAAARAARISSARRESS